VADINDLIKSIDKLIKKMDSKGDGNSSGRSYDFDDKNTRPSTDAVKKFNEELDKQADTLKAIADIQNLRKVQETEGATAIIEKYKETKKALSELEKKHKDINRFTPEYAELAEEIKKAKEAVEESAVAFDGLGDEVKESAKAFAKLEPAVQKATVKLNDFAKAAEKSVDEQYAEAIKDLKNEFLGMTGAVNSTQTTVGKLAETMALAKVSGNSFIKSMTENILTMQNGANAAASVASKLKEALAVGTIDVMQDFESGVRGFQSSTGLLNANIEGVTEAGDDLEQFIVKSTMGVRKYGVTIQDTSAALQAFTAEGLLRTSQGQEVLRDGQLKNIALLSKLGVSAETTSKSFKSLTMNIGFDAAQSMTIISDRITALGRATGVGVAEMQSRFAEALPRLSLYGKRAVDIFEEVQASATTLGVSADSILSLGESFQTFEGAAEAAGQLNAVLGGNLLDPIEMMRQSFDDPAAAAMKIREVFQQSRKSIEGMNSMEIKFIAERIGMDVESARKFLSGQMDKDAVTKIQAEANITLEESARETLSVLEATRAQAAEGNMAMLDTMGMLGGGMYETARSVATGFAALNSGFTGLAIGIGAFVTQAIIQYRITNSQHQREMATLNQIQANTAKTAAATQADLMKGDGDGNGSTGGVPFIAGGGFMKALGIVGAVAGLGATVYGAYQMSQGKVDAARAAKAQEHTNMAAQATPLAQFATPAGPTPGPSVPGPAAPAGAKAAARTKQTTPGTSMSELLTAQRDTTTALGGLMTELRQQNSKLDKIAKNTGSTAASLTQ